MNKIFSYFSVLVAICALLQVPVLEAGGWGKTDQVVEFEGTTWNGVFLDMNGLSFTGLVPNFSGAGMQNGSVTLSGQVKDAGYIITTSMNPGFKPPKTVEAFVKLIKDANPGFLVVAINSKILGAKYAVDLIPVNQDDTAFWRFLSTNDRIIQMGTDDANDKRRLNFFESIRIN